MPKGATGSWVPRPILLARLVGPLVRNIFLPAGSIGPRDLALNAANNRLYVANYGAKTAGNTVSVIDTTRV